MSINLWKSRLG